MGEEHVLGFQALLNPSFTLPPVTSRPLSRVAPRRRGASPWPGQGCDPDVPDAEDIWETAIATAKDSGVSWNDLEAGTGLYRPTLQTKLRARPARELAAKPRRPRWTAAEIAERIRVRRGYGRPKTEGAA